MTPDYPRRLKNFSYTGFYRYSLRFCTHQRRPIFASPEAVDLVLSQIRRSATIEQFVLAYCFMPDHVHLLVEGRSESSDCRRFMARAKQLSGFHYARQWGSPLWQRYGYERVLRDEEHTLAAARYILGNPVRAGLVDQPQTYPFLGSDVCSLREILEDVRSG